MNDLATLAHRVERQVSTRDLAGRRHRVLTTCSTVPKEIRRVWHAITDPRELHCWFDAVSGDIQQGGRFQVFDGASGDIVACIPCSRFTVSWELGEDTSWVEVSVTMPDPGHTVLRIDYAAPDDNRAWEVYGLAGEGLTWDLAHIGLQLFLADDYVLDQYAELRAWLSGDDGQALLRQCIETWCEIDIASGTDATKARLAASRVTKLNSIR